MFIRISRMLAGFDRHRSSDSAAARRTWSLPESCQAYTERSSSRAGGKLSLLICSQTDTRHLAANEGRKKHCTLGRCRNVPLHECVPGGVVSPFGHYAGSRTPFHLPSIMQTSNWSGTNPRGLSNPDWPARCFGMCCN